LPHPYTHRCHLLHLCATATPAPPLLRHDASTYCGHRRAWRMNKRRARHDSLNIISGRTLRRSYKTLDRNLEGGCFSISNLELKQWLAPPLVNRRASTRLRTYAYGISCAEWRDNSPFARGDSRCYSRPTVMISAVKSRGARLSALYRVWAERAVGQGLPASAATSMPSSKAQTAHAFHARLLRTIPAHYPQAARVRGTPEKTPSTP